MRTEPLTEKTGHLAWCALVALHVARLDGLVGSVSQENIFLIRWLSTALKQHRFPREVAPDIHWLLKQGRTLGARSELRDKLEYLWRTCNGVLLEQNDLFRLTYAIETAKQMDFTFHHLNDREWSGRNRFSANPVMDAIYLSRSSLDVSFNEDGKQIAPLMVRLTGNTARLENILNRYGWCTENCADHQIPSLYRLVVHRPLNQ
ncbi:MAG: DUF2913 family protein [Pantoea sp.]|uniref:DUF2913 family protein n=1 Tax=unclassified Pantoea TaxID=2630326 RepID=UPI0003AC7BC2|nr:DUF2913 family protein [Pantoea sp. AS-PWVM4]ERK15166.1 hypothetical protein L579_4511 [Pantoea sp. AS-PWVM4]